MLGDAGANALGAALGLGALLTLGPGARLALTGGAAGAERGRRRDVVQPSDQEDAPVLDRLDRLGGLRA